MISASRWMSIGRSRRDTKVTGACHGIDFPMVACGVLLVMTIGMPLAWPQIADPAPSESGEDESLIVGDSGMAGDEPAARVPAMAPFDLLERSAGSLEATLAECCGLEFSGFWDLTVSDLQSNPDRVASGDFELDMVQSLGRNLQASAAVVMNAEGGPELTVGFVDLHLRGRRVAPRGALFLEKGFHVQFGRFDVPFGNDWIYFASVDRPTIMAPQSTELVMDGGLNDWGGRVYGSSMSYNYVLMLLRGLGTGAAVGGRFAFTPFSDPYSFTGNLEGHPLEIGFSYLYDASREGGFDQKAWAVDGNLQLGRMQLMGEFVRRISAPDEDLEGADLSGIHATSVLDISDRVPLLSSLFARIERFSDLNAAAAAQPPIDGQMKVEEIDSRRTGYRLGLGFNASLHNCLVAKLEYQRWMGADIENLTGFGPSRNALATQLVILF